MRSISLYGLSDVILTYHDGTDNYFARQEVFNRLSELSLPTGVTPSVSPLSSPSGLIYRYVLQSPDRSPMELKTFEDWIIEPAIQIRRRAWRMIPALAAAPCNTRCCSIRPRSPASACRCRRWRARWRPTTATPAAGSIRKAASSITCAAWGASDTLEDIGNVVLAVHDGTPVLVKDVGRVVIGIAPRLGEFGYEKQDDAVEGVILLRTGEKTQDVLKRVEAKTKELNEQILPKDVKVVPFYDRTDLIALTTAGRGAKPAARHVAGRRGPDLLPLRFSRRA